jgi:spermidine/putrescine transport system permease protein
MSPGTGGRGRLWLLALPPALYVFAFATVPLGLLLLYSFYRADFVAIVKEPSLANYAAVLGSATYRALMLKALGYGVTVAAITAVIAYPFAFFVAKRVRVLKAALLTLMLIPLYTGDLIRIFAWRVVLGAEGVLNSLLLWLGLIEEPIWALLFSPTATLIVLTYDYLPFMVLALWASFEGLDRSYLEAAADLGASRTQTFLRVVLPLTSPGLLAGFLMVLVLVAGDYLTPQLVGGSSGVTVTSAIHDLFGAAFDWPMASALAWVLLAVLALTVALAVSLFRRSPLGRSLQRSVS